MPREFFKTTACRSKWASRVQLAPAKAVATIKTVRSVRFPTAKSDCRSPSLGASRRKKHTLSNRHGKVLTVDVRNDVLPVSLMVFFGESGDLGVEELQQRQDRHGTIAGCRLRFRSFAKASEESTGEHTMAQFGHFDGELSLRGRGYEK